MKRSGKFYRKNEEEVMKRLGLKPTKNSGSSWIEKEDGQSDKIICQLKSSDKESIKVNRLDIEKLENNALVSHKLPVFAIQFINKEVYLLVKPIDLPVISKYIRTGIIERTEVLGDYKENKKSVKTIKSSENARLTFKNKLAKKYMRKEKSAK